MKKPKTPQVLPVFFTREQFTLLLSKLEDRELRELATFTALTGLRLGEPLTMRWELIDFSRRILAVQNSEIFTTKSKRAWVVPLSDEALKVLLARRERVLPAVSLVFTRRGRAMDATRESKGFKKTVRTANHPDTLHFHSLRHTFASLLVQGGGALHQVSRLLGHSSRAVTVIYARLVPENMHSVLAPLHLEN